MNQDPNTTENLTIALLSWETRLLLEGLAKLEAELRHINATSRDEDEVADAGNDLAQLLILKNRLEADAVKIFGESIKDLDKSALL